MTFQDFLRAIGYDPQPYTWMSIGPCWSLAGHGLTLGIFAAAILDYEQDTRLDPGTRAMAIRALRAAREDSLGRGGVIYFPTEKVST